MHFVQCLHKERRTESEISVLPTERLDRYRNGLIKLQKLFQLWAWERPKVTLTLTL